MIHTLVVVGLFWQQLQIAEEARANELKFGSSGGGGGEDEQDRIIQFGPQSDPQQGTTGLENTSKFTLLDIKVYSDEIKAQPVSVKEEPKPTVTKKGKKQQKKIIIAENLPTQWVRRGTGPGTGGGAGGGSGGGIGRGTGYSIDWGGTGGRRLLSGVLPKYPEGTDKQMAVTLQFTVSPDGSVDAIIPTRKTDELLEGASISALRTWRFDPLPTEMEQKNQVGKVTFNFKLEH
ncbi:MAG: TonB family protein [Ignavibacteriae bacterium]|nr:TonB family protein [Ignavibacteriota bacterium]